MWSEMCLHIRSSFRSFRPCFFLSFLPAFLPSFVFASPLPRRCRSSLPAAPSTCDAFMMFAPITSIFYVSGGDCVVLMICIVKVYMWERAHCSSVLVFLLPHLSPSPSRPFIPFFFLLLLLLLLLLPTKVASRWCHPCGSTISFSLGFFSGVVASREKRIAASGGGGEGGGEGGA